MSMTSQPSNWQRTRLWPYLWRSPDYYTSTEAADLRKIVESYNSIFSPNQEEKASLYLAFENSQISNRPAKRIDSLTEVREELTHPLRQHNNPLPARRGPQVQDLIKMLRDFLRPWSKKKWANDPASLLCYQLKKEFEDLAKSSVSLEAVTKVNKIIAFVDSLYKNQAIAFNEVQQLLFNLKERLKAKAAIINNEIEQITINEKLHDLIAVGKAIVGECLPYLLLVLRDSDATDYQNEIENLYFEEPTGGFKALLTSTYTGGLLNTLVSSNATKQLLQENISRATTTTLLGTVTLTAPQSPLALQAATAQQIVAYAPLSPTSSSTLTPNSSTYNPNNEAKITIFPPPSPTTFLNSQTREYYPAAAIMEHFRLVILQGKKEEQAALGLSPLFYANKQEDKDISKVVSSFIKLHGLLEIYSQILLFFTNTSRLLNLLGDVFVQALIQDEFDRLITDHDTVVTAINQELAIIHTATLTRHKRLLDRKLTESTPWYNNVLVADRWHDKILAHLKESEAITANVKKSIKTLKFSPAQLRNEILTFKQSIAQFETDYHWLNSTRPALMIPNEQDTEIQLSPRSSHPIPIIRNRSATPEARIVTSYSSSYYATALSEIHEDDSKDDTIASSTAAVTQPLSQQSFSPPDIPKISNLEIKDNSDNSIDTETDYQKLRNKIKTGIWCTRFDSNKLSSNDIFNILNKVHNSHSEYKDRASYVVNYLLQSRAWWKFWTGKRFTDIIAPTERLALYQLNDPIINEAIKNNRAFCQAVAKTTIAAVSGDSDDKATAEECGEKVAKILVNDECGSILGNSFSKYVIDPSKKYLKYLRDNWQALTKGQLIVATSNLLHIFNNRSFAEWLGNYSTSEINGLCQEMIKHIINAIKSEDITRAEFDAIITNIKSHHLSQSSLLVTVEKATTNLDHHTLSSSSDIASHLPQDKPVHHDSSPISATITDEKESKQPKTTNENDEQVTTPTIPRFGGQLSYLSSPKPRPLRILS